MALICIEDARALELTRRTIDASSWQARVCIDLHGVLRFFLEAQAQVLVTDSIVSLRAVRMDPNGARVPVVFLENPVADEKELFEAYKCGADLVVPAGTSDLVAWLEALATSH